jgi:hypothetical protein
MVRELREMKQSLKESMQSNTDIIRELKDMNVAMLRGNAAVNNFQLNQQEAPKEEAKVIPEVVVPVEHRIELTEDDKAKLSELFQTWLNSFEEADRVNLVKFFKLPLKAAIKEPAKRIIDLSNSMYKKFYDKKPEEFKTFLMGAGYTLLSATRYQFVKPEEPSEELKFHGNIEVLENLARLFEEEAAK